MSAHLAGHRRGRLRDRDPAIGPGARRHIFLGAYYSSYGDVGAVDIGRGGSTLALPIAAADLFTFNTAIAIGFLSQSRRRRTTVVMLLLTALYLVGVMAAAEFSGMLGAVVGLVVAAVLTGGCDSSPSPCRPPWSVRSRSGR